MLPPVQPEECSVSVLFKSACLVACGLFAGLAAAADLEVKDPWVRGTVPAQKVTGAFMQLTSKSGVTVLGAASPAAGIVEIHEMAMDGGVMKMRALPRLDVPAGKAVELKPGGYHIMLIDLKKPLAAGDVVPITLKVEGQDKKPENVELKATVRALTAAPGMDHEHHHHGH